MCEARSDCPAPPAIPAGSGSVPAPAGAGRGRLIAAFAAIYVIWGSTYLAIKIGISTLPPFLLAGARFLVAGGVLLAWARLRGGALPTGRQWGGATRVGALLLLGGNGGVMWAETRVPSGLAAVLIATVPVWIVLLEAASGAGARPGRSMIAGVAIGLLGVALLVGPSALGGEGPLDLLGAAALLLAAGSWSVGSLLSRRVPLPSSRVVATGAEMLAGGALLTLAGLATGEAAQVDPARVSHASLLALGYLIVFGSLVAFTAYVWLLSVTSATRVATYAYVNPVVALLLGWGFAGEPLTGATLGAVAVIVLGVAVTVTARTA